MPHFFSAKSTQLGDGNAKADLKQVGFCVIFITFLTKLYKNGKMTRSENSDVKGKT